ncbi:MAG: cytidylate kinase-like family protein [Verrucomicrobia bacterium]|nr:cytidylate kinase-like family protein [Verrucomicrobiota bacterium]
MHPDLEKCHAYVVCHLTGDNRPIHTAKTAMPFVTISRQTGAGGRTLGKILQAYLDMKCSLPESDWTLFDRNLVETAMKEHGLPRRFAQYLPESRVSELSAVVGELLGLHPPLWDLNQHVYETLIHLANIGGVILVGRGANVVTRKLKYGFHLRLVGSLEKRAKRTAIYYKMSLPQARTFVEHEDKARRLWVKDNLDEDINDPNLYHLTINTDSLSMEDVASMVGCHLQKWMPVLQQMG